MYGPSIIMRPGVSIPGLRKLSKELGKDRDLALNQQNKGIADARILASMVDDPEKPSERQLEEWVQVFDLWDF
jgi:3-methyladenine DNA glycosylase AlkD